MFLLLLMAACGTSDSISDSKAPSVHTGPWDGGLSPTTIDMASIRQWTPARTIMHLHSPWSHDACDGDGLPEGEINADCLSDLRYALCRTSIDIAYLSDHPDYAAFQDFEQLLLAGEDDEVVHSNGVPIGVRIACENGHRPLWRVGIEDELMPLGLERHTAHEDPSENHRLYNASTPEAIESHASAGAFVTVAHTEGKTLEVLDDLVQNGVQGVELFNLHAMFDPRKRAEDLGLDPLGWATDIAPFTRPDATGEPDLFFLAVFAEQTPSIERWDALQAIAPVVGFAGTDAHQNVLPIDLRDGDRGDSYRRMLRWFSNHLLIQADSWPPTPEAADEALAQGRLYTAFEILGTPTGLDFHLRGSGDSIVEMGSSGQGSELYVSCPTLSDASPSSGAEPEISADIFRDGELWASGCGEYAVTEPGSYRLRVSITPHHLTDFLGQTPEEWLQSYPWVYTNPIRVR